MALFIETTCSVCKQTMRIQKPMLRLLGNRCHPCAMKARQKPAVKTRCTRCGGTFDTSRGYTRCEKCRRVNPTNCPTCRVPITEHAKCRSCRALCHDSSSLPVVNGVCAGCRIGYVAFDRSLVTVWPPQATISVVLGIIPFKPRREV